MFYYYAYGLKIESDIPLPVLVSGCCDRVHSAKVPVDVFVNLKSGSCGHTEPPGNKDVFWNIARENAVLMIKGLGTFYIQHGKEITIHPASRLDEKMIQIIVINSLLAIVLYQRKTLVLHASAVRIGNAAAAFLGTSGAGKSIMAGALCARGHALVAEDVVALEFSPSLPRVYPGYPMIKMKPHESAMLGFPDQSIRLLHEKEKRYACSVLDGFATSPCPLSHIFVLSKGEDRLIQRITAKESFLELICNSPPAIWDVRPDQLQFSRVGELVKKVPVSRIIRENCVAAIPEHARMIEEYLYEMEPVQESHSDFTGFDTHDVEPGQCQREVPTLLQKMA